MRAIVHGLARGLQVRAGQEVKERIGGPRGGPPPMGKAGRGREGMPAEFKAWVQGYLDGATAGMSPEQARRVREICRGAIKAGWEFRQEQQETRQDNLHHFLHLRGISAGLDIMILKATGD